MALLKKNVYFVNGYAFFYFSALSFLRQIMKYSLLTAIVLFSFFACTKEQKAETLAYKSRDYREVKLRLDTLNAKLQAEADSTGTFTFPYTDLVNGKKHLIFFGASHTRDLEHPQFLQIENAFRKMKPEIAFNEGGQIPETLSYPTLDSAVRGNGETGLLKYLCDVSGIKMMNGDMEDIQEFAELQKTIPKDQIYLYMAIERYLNGYKKGYFPSISLEEGWNTKFIPYLRRSDFKLTPEEESLDSLKKIYKHYLQKDFSIDSLMEVQEYYLINDGLLGDVGRATKIARDQALLQKIDNALDQYDKVFVVFGGSHRVAVEPALKQIIDKKR